MLMIIVIVSLIVSFSFMLILVLIAVSIGKKMAAARTRELAVFAKENGISFEPNSVLTLPRLPLFQRSGSVKNIMRLEEGVAWTIFDYAYLKASYKYSIVIAQTVYMAEISEKVPTFSIWPKNAALSLAEFSGFKQADIVSNTDFSRKFFIESSDRRISEFFSKEIVDYFCSNLQYAIEVAKGSIIFYKPCLQTQASDIKESVKIIKALYMKILDAANQFA